MRILIMDHELLSTLNGRCLNLSYVLTEDRVPMPSTNSAI